MKEVFVGRAKEIESFFKFLKSKNCPAFVVIGEPGIGKSSFMREVAERLRRDEKFVVGFHEVPFSGGVANPFVGVLEKLVDDLAARRKEQVRSTLKRFAEAARNVAIKKGDRIARAFVKDLVIKLVGKHVVEELEDIKKEFDETHTIYSLSDEFVRERRSEFIYDFQEFFEELVREFHDREFVLLIDQFERAPMLSCDVFLDFARGRHENVHVAVALKVEEKGYERFNYVKPHLEQMDAEIVELQPLSVGEIGEWMQCLGKEFSYPELKKIEKLSAVFPFAISEWLGTSKECDLGELEARKGKYCDFVRSRVDNVKDKECRLMLRKLSVLLQPLSVGDYEKLGGIETGCCGLFMNELVDKRILDKYGDTFWFRHELIRFCVEQDLTEPENRKYHEAAARFFQLKFDEALKANEKVDFDVGLGCAYHWHLAGKYKESLEHNLQFASFCFDTGSFDVAEDCFLRAIEDAEALGDEDSKLVTKGDLANVYYVWGRLVEAFKTCSELRDYFRGKSDERKEAVSLHQLGMIAQDRGNYDDARRLYEQSLEINKKLADQKGIAESLHQLARIEEDAGNYDKAEKLHRRSLEIKLKLGDQSGIARSLHQFAVIECYRGNYKKATELCQKSLEIERKLGDQRGMALTYGQLGRLYESLNKPAIAADYYLKALNIFQKIGDKPNAAKAKRDHERATKQKTAK